MTLTEKELGGAKTIDLLRLAKSLGIEAHSSRGELIQAIAAKIKQQEPPKWRSGWM
jgi:hypothetical protein